MFGILGGTGVIGGTLALTYDYIWIRYGLVVAGIIAFMIYFNKYGQQLLKLRKKRKDGNG